jgi:hypothetical protein
VKTEFFSIASCLGRSGRQWAERMGGALFGTSRESAWVSCEGGWKHHVPADEDKLQTLKQESD